MHSLVLYFEGTVIAITYLYGIVSGFLRIIKTVNGKNIQHIQTVLHTIHTHTHTHTHTYIYIYIYTFVTISKQTNVY